MLSWLIRFFEYRFAHTLREGNPYAKRKRLQKKDNASWIREFWWELQFRSGTRNACDPHPALRAALSQWERAAPHGISRPGLCRFMVRPDGYVKVLDFGLASYDDRPSTAMRVKVEPRLEPLRSDRRFADFVRKMGLQS
jgi:hypothetical protein